MRDWPHRQDFPKNLLKHFIFHKQNTFSSFFLSYSLSLSIIQFYFMNSSLFICTDSFGGGVFSFVLLAATKTNSIPSFRTETKLYSVFFSFVNSILISIFFFISTQFVFCMFFWLSVKPYAIHFDDDESHTFDVNQILWWLF